MPLYSSPNTEVNLLSWKEAVRAATTAALPANTAPTVLTLVASANGALAAQDGVTLIAGDRLLVKNEATTANNGIYIVTAVGSAGTPYVLTRSGDFDQWDLEIPSAIVPVEEGTSNADTTWICTSNRGGTLGTTAITFTQYAFGNVTAAANITDNAIVRGDGGAKGIQGSAITIADASGNNVTMSAITDTALTFTTLDNNRDITFTPHGTGLVRFSKSAVPNASDGAALGSAALPWSDAFFASGGVIDFAGDVTLTHGTDILTMAGGRFVNNFNAAASSPPVSVTGSWFSGGSATTTKPQLLIEASGATSTGWSTSGTGVGVNAASGFAGRLFDLQVNGVTQANFSAAGDFAGNGAMSAAGGVMARNATATPAGGSSQCFSMGSVGIGISFGSGAPSTSRPKGSWYMRTDGSGVNDRAYVATDAVGGWTAFVTVA